MALEIDNRAVILFWLVNKKKEKDKVNLFIQVLYLTN